jgi:hypothetical protein
MATMFNLFEMLQQSQNGAAIDAVAKQFGLTPRQAENAVDVLLPAFTVALQRQMMNPQMWPTLFSAMQPPAASSAPQAFEAASRAFAHDSMRQGADFMQGLFGTSDLSKQVAAQAAAASGLPATILQQMMPALGTMLASGMLKTFSQEGLAGVITAMQRGMSGMAPASAGPLAGPFAAYFDMMSRMMGGGADPAASAAAPEQEQRAAPGAGADTDAETAPLPNPFNPADMGAYFGHMMSAATAAASATPTSETPPSDEDGTAGEATAGKKPAKASAAPAAAPAAAPTAAPAESAASAEANPMEVLFETGREVQDQYLRNLQELFDSMQPHDTGTAQG